MEAIHPKAMPVILHEEDYGRWLDGDVEEGTAHELCSEAEWVDRLDRSQPWALEQFEMEAQDAY